MTYEQFLLALCVWREARGESLDAKSGVAWTIRNRAARPSWWGHDIYSVITCRDQYSSFDPGDINASKFPQPLDSAWKDCVDVATGAFPDPTDGCTHYFDKSRDNDPPAWAAKMTHVMDIGALRFYR